MLDFIRKWTKEEFKLYLLIYASQSNLFESDEELEFIESKFNKDKIHKIHKEVEKLNDYYRCQIIIDFIKLNNFSQDELDNILLSIKEIFNSDGSFDMIEQQSFYMLEKLLKI